MKEHVVAALSFLDLSQEELERLVEVPKDPTMGDYSLPCFSLAKQLGKNPADIAADVASQIGENEAFERVIAQGPYVNFFVNRKVFADNIIRRIRKEGNRYGGTKNSRRRIMIEFSQPNTHKAFHVGHIRGTSIGESLARIAEFSGDTVVRANYSGDTGMHIAKWLWCYLNYHSHEELRNDESWIAGIYTDAVQRLEKDEALQEAVDTINQKLDTREDSALNKIWEKTRALSIDSWQKIYHELGARFDVHFFESEVEARGKELSQELVQKHIALKSDGATIMDLKDDGLSVWVLLRKDGTVLYSAKDLALAEKKFAAFDINNSLIITGSEQDLHFRQLQKTLTLMNFSHAQHYDHASYGLIRFPWGKMSSRTGDNVLYSTLKKEMVAAATTEIEKRYKVDSVELHDRALAIALAAIKYSILKQDMHKTIIFDPKKAISFEGDTGPYLLYSYARSQSILRKAGYQKQKEFSFGEITDSEKQLVTLLARFPDIVTKTHQDHAPNLVANYAYELAQTFSDFYHNVRVIGSGEEQFRLRLVDCFAQVMHNALFLLGIPVIAEM